MKGIFKIIIIISGLIFITGGIFYPKVHYRKNISFNDLQSFFKELAKKHGASYAFEALRVAHLPPNTDIHLLGHTIGDILYKQQGLQGIKICTQDFRNACSHSIVVGLFIDKGVQALIDIAEVCRHAPGGPGAYGMCFHGLGHGILAYAGYDMAKAVELCRQTGTPTMNYVEASECIGGVVMEMIGGVHDKLAWEKQKDKYFKKENPLFPCDQSFIPAVAKPNCYLYLTPHLWEVAGGDIGNPKDADFKTSFQYCSKLTGDNAVFRELCYGGFGKEFVTLAESRDIRKTEIMNPSQLKQVYDWCLLADDTNGTSSCIRQAVNSLYWGGENSANVSASFCKIMDDQVFQRVCYGHLIGSFKYYNLHRPSRLYGLCRTLPESFKKECLNSNFHERID